MSDLQNPVLLAKIGAPHGVRGEVRVTSFTQDPMALGDYGVLSSKDGRIFTVAKARPAKNVLVVNFKELQSREMAEKARNVELFVEREMLPQDINDDEFYVDDLVGMEVVNSDEEIVGEIHAVPNFGADDLLEISPKLEGGGFGRYTWFIAFTADNVPDIDLVRRRVTIVKPAEISERDPDDAGEESVRDEAGRDE